MSEQIPVFFATSNSGKQRELKLIFEEMFPKNAGPILGRAPREAEESASDFQGNARIKAEALEAELIQEGLSQYFIIADDSGLCVDALDGAPGLFSARYSGVHNPNSIQNYQKLLIELGRVGAKTPEQRKAHYHCALYAIEKSPSARMSLAVQGQCHGWIGFEPRGELGFGYDPVFMHPTLQVSYGELPGSQKNRESHRWQAFHKLKQAYDHAWSIA